MPTRTRKKSAATSKAAPAPAPALKRKPAITLRVITKDAHGTRHRDYTGKQMEEFLATQEGADFLRHLNIKTPPPSSMATDNRREVCADILAKYPGKFRKDEWNKMVVAAMEGIQPPMHLRGILTMQDQAEMHRRLYREPETAPGEPEVAPEEKNLQAFRDGLELAWGIIANAGKPQGDWKSMPEDWQKAAAAWRDKYLGMAYSDAPPRGPRRLTIPQVFTVNGQEIRVVATPDILRHDNPRTVHYDPAQSAICVQTPTAHYHPVQAVMEKAYFYGLALAMLEQAGLRELAKTPEVPRAFANFMHQYELSKWGNLNLHLDNDED